ncbi:hypothetical protein OQA88_7908 [Cercophora sp. LCS_1]
MATTEQIKESKLSRLLNRRPASKLTSKENALLDPRTGQRYLEDVLAAHDDNAGADETTFSTCSWATVFKQMAEARDAHANQGLSNSKLAGIEVTTQYVDLIPDEYGLGVIKGTLGLIFESVKRGIENKAKIQEALESLPETILTINTACAYLDATDSDISVQREFYSSVLTQLPKLVELLLRKEKWYKAAWSFVSLRAQETTTIDQILGDWNAMLAKVQQHVERMKAKVMARTLHHSSEGHRHASEANKKLDVLATSAGLIGGSLDRLEFMFLALAKAVLNERSTDTTQPCLQYKDTAAEAQTGMLDDMFAKIRDVEREREYYRQRMQTEQKNNVHLRLENSKLAHKYEILRASPLLIESEFETEPEPLVTTLELIGILSPSVSYLEDFDYALNQGPKFGQQQLSRARWLLRTDEFHDWFQGHRSSLLLVEGRFSNSTSALSPLSVLASTFTASLQASQSDIVLYYFAGLHCSGGNPSRPNEMLRSLIIQLLLSDKLPDPALGFLEDEFLTACQAHETLSLCQLFEELVLQIPEFTQVFVVIDGLEWYEQNYSWAMDLKRIMAMFEHLTGEMDEGQFSFFKVMMFFANHSLEISDRAERREDIWTMASLAAGWRDPTNVSPFVEVGSFDDGD